MGKGKIVKSQSKGVEMELERVEEKRVAERNNVATAVVSSQGMVQQLYDTDLGSSKQLRGKVHCTS